MVRHALLLMLVASGVTSCVVMDKPNLEAPVERFVHRTANSEVVLLWNCVRPAPEVLRTLLYRALADSFERFLGVYEKRFEPTHGYLRRVRARRPDRLLLQAALPLPVLPPEARAALGRVGRGAPRGSAASAGGLHRSEAAAEPVLHRRSQPIQHFFRFDRKLLGELPGCAWRALRLYFAAWFGSEEVGEGVVPGAVGFVQTAGELLGWHPHLHVLLTDGGWLPDGTFRSGSSSTSPDDRGGSLRDLEPDFAAVIAPGLQLAFRDRIRLSLSGPTIVGEDATREIWVCGPGAFFVLKALAFELRGEDKDAYDLFYVLRNYGASLEDVVERLRPLLGDENTTRTIEILRRDFLNENGVGPRLVAEFQTGGPDEAIQADVVGLVGDLLRRLGVSK